MRPEEQKAKWEELELRQEEELSDVVTMKMGTNAGNETTFVSAPHFSFVFVFVVFFFLRGRGLHDHFLINPSLSTWVKRQST